MDKKISNFQMGFIVVFIVGAVAAVLIFSGAIPLGESKKGVEGATGTVVMWGTVRRESVANVLAGFNQINETFSVSYVQKNPATFNSELIEALASGKGPDMIMISSDLMPRYSDKIYPIPFQSYPERSFRDLFISEADLYIGSKGIYGFPLFVDPMVMYYNRNMFEFEGIAKPPTTWDELITIVPKLTKKEGIFINQNAVAFGEMSNVTHGKDIISLLALQYGNPLAVQNGETVESVANASTNTSFSTLGDALGFYTSFANSTNTSLYSWNKGFPSSREQFVAGKLAMYFGYSSELFSIQDQNPNLDFDVTSVPQKSGSNQVITFGKVTGVSVLKSSKNLTTAYIAASLMTSRDFVTSLVNEQSVYKVSVVPARRDLLAQIPNSYYAPIFYKAGLVSRGWLDPKDEETDLVFSDAITDINSGRLIMKDVVEKVHTDLSFLFKGMIY